MNNRQAGRRRGRGGQRPGQGGAPGRTDTGNRIDNRARGNAAQLLEKYKSLAQESQRSGDRVTTEYYLQHADHYFRVLSENRARFEDTRRPVDDEGDDDYGYEGEPVGQSSYQTAPRDDREPRDGNRDDRDMVRDGAREDGAREMREPRRDDRDAGRDSGRDAGRDTGRDMERANGRESSRDVAREEGREPRPPRQPRADRGNGDYRRDAANGRDDDDQRRDEAPRETLRREPRGGYAAPRASGFEGGFDGDAEPRDERPVAANDEPRRRGRPRRDAAAANEDPVGLDIDRLPPAIEAVAPASEEAPRPRRGRPRKVRVEDEAVPPAA